MTNNTSPPIHRQLIAALLTLDAHKEQFIEAPRSNSDIPSLVSNHWSDEQFAYIQQRADHYDIDPYWILDQLPTYLILEPSAAIDALDRAGRLPGMQIEHIISQHNAPHLASDTSNIILAPADGFNQATGSQNYTAADVQQRLQSQTSYYQETADAYNLNDSELFTFQDSWDLFGELTRGSLRAIFAFSYVDKAVWKQTIRLGQRIVNDMPHVTDRATRLRMLDDIAHHIDACAENGSIHTAYLMLLLIINVPWAAALLAIKGLSSLAKLITNKADLLLEHLESHRFLGPIAKLLRLVSKPLARLIAIFDGILSTCWMQIEEAARFAGDCLASIYKAGKALIQSIWQGATNLFNFFSRRASYA